MNPHTEVMMNELVEVRPFHRELVDALVDETGHECWELAMIARHVEQTPKTSVSDIAHRCGVSPKYLNNRAKETGWPGPGMIRRMVRLGGALRHYLDGATLEDAAAAGLMDLPSLSTGIDIFLGVRPSEIPEDSSVTALVIAGWKAAS